MKILKIEKIELLPSINQQHKIQYLSGNINPVTYEPQARNLSILSKALSNNMDDVIRELKFKHNQQRCSEEY